MTRETKVGLVVAASFLCLVGVVVASRLGRNADPKQGETVAQSITPQHEPNPKPVIDPKHETEPPKNKDPHAKPTQTTPSSPELVPVGLTTPPPVKHGEPDKLPWQVPPVAPPPLGTTAAAPHVALNPKKNSPGEAIDKEQQDKIAALKRAKEGANGSATGTGAHTEKTVDGLPPPVSAAALNLFPTPGDPGAVAPFNKEDGFFAPAAPSQHPDHARAVDPSAVPKKETPDTPPVVHPSPPPKVEEAAKWNNATPVIPPAFAPGGSVSPPTPPTNPPKASQDIFPPPPVTPMADSKPKHLDPTPVAGNTHTSPGQLALNQHSPDPVKSPFDVGAKPAPPVVVPTVPAKPPSGPLPQVKVIDIETYECKADDTFETVSTRFFATPKYARALLQYNRENPLANKDNLLQDNPRLQPRQIVFVPSQQFLDTRFASLIDSRPNVAAVAPAISIKPPVSANAASQPMGIPTVVTSDATKAYRVPDQGQMLIEIAQQKLGDRGRWSEIYRLNPSLRPEFPIPGGTEIRLPGNSP